jgi:hypothetical protein
MTAIPIPDKPGRTYILPRDYSPTSTAEPEFCVAATGGPALMLRERPEIEMNWVASLEDGEQMQILGEWHGRGKIRTWLFVKTEGGLHGWVAGMYCRKGVE